MNLELFIARRLYGTRKGAKRISRPAVTIAQWGVAIGTLVMMVSICIIVGFKQQIREKVIGFGGHINILSYESSSNKEIAINATPALMKALDDMPEVKSVNPFIYKPGMILAGGEYEGVVLKGVGGSHDLSYIAGNVVAGEIPCFSDTVTSNSIVISRNLASRLQVSVGDRVYLYFFQDGMKARHLAIAAIYETYLAEVDDLIALTDIYTLRRVCGWDDDEVTGIEVTVNDYSRLYDVQEKICDAADKYGDSSDMLYAPAVDELYPALFAWLDVLDQTVWLILLLVLFIAGFTMVSGLLILILEKTNFIGILKAVGARNVSIGKVFVYYACIIILKGLLIGNVVGFSLCLLQRKFCLVGLDPEMYYMNSVPVEFTWLLLPMNIGMFIISLLMLLVPSMLVAKIEPTKAIKFE